MLTIQRKIIAFLLAMCLILSNSWTLLNSVSLAASETEEVNQIEINQEITKYIPYSYSEEDMGVILEQKIEIKTQIKDYSKKEISAIIPTYWDIKPEKIVVRTKKAELTNDDTLNTYFQIDEDKTQITITQNELKEEEYYITYYYPKDAYDKYLDTTHVKDYPEGQIVDIQKNEETGETWVYIDFEWDEEENEGEMPDNKHLLDKTQIELNTKVEITDNLGLTSAESKITKEIDIAISSLIDNNITSNQTEITKGKLYAKKEINYEIENEISILRSDISNTVKIKDLGTAFISNDDTQNKVSEKYNFIQVQKSNLEEILGEEGYIRILNNNEEEITNINSSLEADENGNISYTFTEEINEIIIEINGIKNDGFLIITENKTINEEQRYTKDQIMNFKNIRIASSLETIDNQNNSQDIEKNVEIVLTESITKANISINNENLSTVSENSGIEFTIELENKEENSDLWENAFLIIEMPEEVEELSINGASLLYGDGLSLHSANLIDINGHKAIKIQLIGKQQDFISDSIIGGTTIVVNTNITLKELTTTSQSNEIKLYYHNSNKTNYENKAQIQLDEIYEVGYSKTTINYIAPIEFKTIHKISGFNESGDIISSENSEKEVGKIQILEPEKQVKENIILINNTGNKTENIKVIGRIPVVGNKDIISGEDLGTTVNAKITSVINYTGKLEKEIKIYYSENEEADTDLEKEENKWTINPETLENIKTYMIVINSMNQGDKLFFEYNLEVPAMLEHGENLYSTLATYYINNTEVGPVEETSKANTIGLSTGIGARAKIELSAGIDTGANLTEGQKVKYTIKVQNTGELTAENVIVRNPIPQGTTYIEETIVENDIETFNKYTYYSSSNELRWEIGDIQSGQTAQLEYTVVIDNYPSILEYYGADEGFTEEDGKYYIISTDTETGEEIKTEITDLPDIEIDNQAILEANNIDKQIYSNEIKNKIAKSYFNIIEESSVQKAVYIEENQSYTYSVIIENKTDLQMKKLEITKIIPDGVTYKSAEIMQGNGNIIIDEKTRKLQIISDIFEGYGTIEISIEVTANKLPEGVYKKEIITNTEVKAEGIQSNISSSVSNTVAKPKITSNIECDVKQRYVYEKDILNYIITVKNENDMTVSNLEISNIIPEGTKFISGSYIQNGNEYTIISDGTREVAVQTNLKQETIIIKIKVQVENITENIEEKEIVNTASMKANNLEEKEIGRIKHTVINTGNSNTGGRKLRRR